MQTYFASISCEFSVQPGDVVPDKAATCIESCKNPELELASFYDNPHVAVIFNFDSKSMIHGEMSFKNDGDTIWVKIEGTAEISVAQAYQEQFLDKSTNWRFSRLSGPFMGEVTIDGLIKVDFKSKKQGKNVNSHYYKLDVKTARQAPIKF